MRERLGAGALFLAAACGACSSPPAAAKRVEMESVGPGAVRLVPRPGQLPFCLVLTVAESGVVRQLTPLDPNEAIPCPPGAPIGGVTYRLPRAEGAVRLHVVFADRRIDGRPIAAQVRELGASRAFTAMDLRAPGNVALETLSYP
jgi:hypothetical protein